MITSPQLRRVRTARTTLLLDQPFFGVLALQLALREDASCQTAWTDGSTLGFNPSFVDTLTQDGLVALIAHEVMHCACGHQWRRDNRDAKRWNVAADYAINAILRDAGFKLPDGALLDTAYDGKASEWIYDRLPQGQQDQPSSGDGDGQPSDQPGGGQQPGEVRDAPSDSSQTEADWQQTVKQAVKMAQAQGKLPGSLRRDIEHQTAPKVDWRSALRRFIQETCKADYSWSRPNTRYLASGLFLPSLHSVACGRLVVAIDTSGSIDAVMLAQFGSEVQAIAEDMQPSSVEVVYCDSSVNHVDTFERGELVTVSPHGGGGTDFRPVFEHVATNDEAPAALIYLTDLDGSFPNDAPDYPVVWCRAVEGYRSEVPFGELIDCA